MPSEEVFERKFPNRKFQIFPTKNPKTYQDAATENLKNVSNVENKILPDGGVENKINANEAGGNVKTNWKFEPTPPVDPRFQQANQTLRCFVMYTDFYRCENILGEGNDACKWFKKVFRTICPNDWISHWDDLRARNLMPWPKSYREQFAARKENTKDEILDCD